MSKADPRTRNKPVAQAAVELSEEQIRSVAQREADICAQLLQDKGVVTLSVRGYSLDGLQETQQQSDRLRRMLQAGGAFRGSQKEQLERMLPLLRQEFPMVAVVTSGWMHVQVEPGEDPRAALGALADSHCDDKGRFECVSLTVYTAQGIWNAVHGVQRTPTVGLLRGELSLSQEADVDGDGQPLMTPGDLAQLLHTPTTPHDRSWERTLAMWLTRTATAEDKSVMAPLLQEMRAGDVDSRRLAVCHRVIDTLMTVRLQDAGPASQAKDAKPEHPEHPDQLEQRLLGLTLRVRPGPGGHMERMPPVQRVARMLDKRVRPACESWVRQAQQHLKNQDLENQDLAVASDASGELLVVGEYTQPPLAHMMLMLLCARTDAKARAAAEGQVSAMRRLLVERARTELAASAAYRDAWGTCITVPMMLQRRTPGVDVYDRMLREGLEPEAQAAVDALRALCEQAAQDVAQELGCQVTVEGLGPFYDELRRKYEQSHRRMLPMLVEHVLQHSAIVGKDVRPADLTMRISSHPVDDGSRLEHVRMLLSYQGQPLGSFDLRRTPYWNLQDFLQKLTHAVTAAGVTKIDVALGPQEALATDAPGADEADDDGQTPVPGVRSRLLH